MVQAPRVRCEPLERKGRESVKNQLRSKKGSASKRAMYPQINTSLIAMANTGKIDVLVAAIEHHLPNMNLVNHSTALHRLAKLLTPKVTNKPQQQMQRFPVVSDLLAAVRCELRRLEAAGTKNPHPQALSNITWALAVLQKVDLPVLEMVGTYAKDNLSGFKAFELSSMLWGFARLSEIDPAVLRPARALFDESSKHIPHRTCDFSFNCLAMTVWAFASVRRGDQCFFEIMAAEMAPLVRASSSQALTQAAWAFRRVQISHSKLLSEIAQFAAERIHEFRPREVADTASWVLEQGVFNAELVLGVGRLARELRAEELAQFFEAASRSEPSHDATRWALLALLPRCKELIHQFRPQGMATLIHSVGRCFGHQATCTGHAPAAISDFLTAVLPGMLPRLCELSCESIADVISCCIKVDSTAVTDGVIIAAGFVVCQRIRIVQTSTLQQFVASLAFVPSAASRRVLCVLLPEVVRRRATLETQGAKRVEHQSVENVEKAQSFDSQESENMRDDSVIGAVSPRHQSAERLGARIGFCVKNTFVDVEDEETPHSSNFHDALSPPLAIMSATVSPDKLQAFRRAYQRFRAGHPCGARGELATNLVHDDDSTDVQSLSSTTAESFSQSTCDVGELSDSCTEASIPEDEAQDKVLAIHWGCYVKNTFLEVDDDTAESASGASAVKIVAASLDAPLAKIPGTVPLDWLTSYRAEYQNFRAGKAAGARGELLEGAVSVPEKYGATAAASA